MYARFFALCLFAAGAALSAGSAAALNCANPQTQLDMDQCAGAALKKSDAELNRIYGQAIHRLKGSPSQTRLFRQSERAWIAYRDAHCNFVASAVEGGSAQPMVQAMCLDDFTKARTKLIEGFLHCPEGDLSCPIPPG
jgi:uncharacterized protein YecT (DUF1311 family)